MKFARARTATRWMFPPLQDDLRAEFASEFFAKLPEFSTRRQIDIVELFSAHFTPAVCSPRSAESIQAFLTAHKDLPPAVLKQLRIDRQEDARCVAIRG